MSIANQNPVNSYVGNGVVTSFAYTFRILSSADLKVEVGGAVQTLGADYTVTGVGDAGGGNVVFAVAPDNSTHNPVVLIYRDIPYERATDYATNGDMLASTVNGDLDRIVMQIQQLYREFKRALKFTRSETDDHVLSSPSARAGKTLSFDSSGNLSLIEFVVPPGTVAVRSVTANTNAIAGDYAIFVDASGGPVTVTLKATMTECVIKKTDISDNAVTITPEAGTIDGAASTNLTVVNEKVRIIKETGDFQTI